MSDEHFHLLTQAKWQNNANRDRDTASPLTGGLPRPCRSITHPEKPPRGHGPPLSLAREFLAWNTYFFTFHSLAGPYGHIKKYVSQAGSSVRTRTGLRGSGPPQAGPLWHRLCLSLLHTCTLGKDWKQTGHVGKSQNPVRPTIA